MMEEMGLSPKAADPVGTVVHVAVDGTYRGRIVISDEIKEDARQAMEELKRVGVQRTVMLTGDAPAVAEDVAKKLAIDEVYAGLLPLGKVEKVEELWKQKSKNGRLAFVGDGINDAPRAFPGGYWGSPWRPGFRCGHRSGGYRDYGR